MAEPLAIKIRRVGERRTRLLCRPRPEYEIVIMDGDVAVFIGTTARSTQWRPAPA